MSKKIKLSERQVKLLNNLDNSGIKITESQYNRLFENNLNESLVVDFLTFANEIIRNLTDILTDPTNVGLDPVWVKLGVSRGRLFSTMIDAGIIATAFYNGKKTYTATKKIGIRSLKFVYNELFGERYDLKSGEVIGGEQEESVGFGSDFERPVEEDNYPAGADNDDNAPWNKEDPEYPEGTGDFFTEIDEIEDSGYRVLFLKGGDNDEKYVSIYRIDSYKYEGFCDRVNSDCVIKKINTLESNGHLKVGYEGFDVDAYVNYVDEDAISYIMNFHVNEEGNKAKLDAILSGLSETTAAAGSSGSYEGALNGGEPIQRKSLRNPSDELNGEVEETTTAAGSSGAYVQPKIWAKDPKNSKFSNKPMYPNGKIVSESGQKLNRYILDLNEAYVYAENDKDAVKEGEEFIKSIKDKFPESHIEIVDIYAEPQGGKEARKIDKNSGSVYEKVAKETGKTISEVMDIINKTKNNH